jgi:hypothetical protein
MPPIWPFKKKAVAVQPTAPDVVEYQRGGDGEAEAALADRSHVEDSSFQAAMDALSQPHLGSPEAGKPAQATEVGENIPLPKPQSGEQWVKNADGYWYRKQADGSFEATAYVENSSGEKVPYSS